MIILIDNGHGLETPGKRSPDGRLREYKYCREIASRLQAELSARGYTAILLVPEERDISISERVRRANAYCTKYGAKNVVLVSIHNNAAGCGGWYTARGWLSMIDDTCSAGSRKLAELLFDEVCRRGLKTRQYLPTQKYYLYHQAYGKPGVRLGILKNTKCPAVLTENFFQDNREDVDWLLSERGKKTIVDIHFDALIKYINS